MSKRIVLLLLTCIFIIGILLTGCNSTASKNDMPYAKFVYEGVKSVQVIDEFTVKIILDRPMAAFLANMTMPQGAPIVSHGVALAAHRSNIKGFALHPIGKHWLNLVSKD